MKKSYAVITAVIVLTLAVLTGMLILFVSKPPNETGGSGNHYSYEVFSADARTVTDLSVSYGDRTIALNCRDSVWTLLRDTEMPVDAAVVQRLLSALSPVTSDKRYTDTSEEARSGFRLTAPDLKITVTDAAYGTRTLQIGKYSASAGGYYANLASDPATVYVIEPDLVTLFGSLTVSDLLFEDALPIVTSKTLDGFDLTADGHSFRFLYDVYGVNQGGITYHWFVCVDGKPSQPVAVDTDTLNGCIIRLSYDRLVSWKQSALPEYGITDDSPTLTVYFTETVTVPGESGNEQQPMSHRFTLRFGGTDEAGTDYVCPEGTTHVYLLSEGEVLSYLTGLALSQIR